MDEAYHQLVQLVRLVRVKETTRIGTSTSSTRDYEEQAPHMGFIDEYDERMFWSLLASKLAHRDLATEPGYEPKKLSVTASKLLLDHPWPGNVREMLNTLRRAAVWTPGPLIDADDARDALLPHPARTSAEDPILAQDVRGGIDLNGIIDRVARHYLEQAMRVTGNNKARASKLLGFGNATTLTNWLKRHGVEP